jgi:hypothetical protein
MLKKSLKHVRSQVVGGLFMDIVRNNKPICSIRGVLARDIA